MYRAMTLVMLLPWLQSWCLKPEIYCTAHTAVFRSVPIGPDPIRLPHATALQSGAFLGQDHKEVACQIINALLGIRESR